MTPSSPGIPIKLDLNIPSPKRECPTCEEEFIPKIGQQRYCSAKCRLSRYKKVDKVSKTCIHCKKRFAPTRANKKTCSDSCKESYRREKGGENYTPANRVEIKCGVCGNIFYGKKSERYCSDKCTAEGYKRRHKKKTVEEKTVEDSSQCQYIPGLVYKEE